METVRAIVLAAVQGLTEFLPISSSAHLILTSRVLGWPDQGLAFDVAVHAGTLLAVLAYFRRDLARMLRPRDPAGHRLLLYLVIATVPLLLAGWLAADLVASRARDARLIAITSIGFGLLLWLADRLGTRRRGLGTLRARDAVLVGLGQAMALIPGTSRSGITLTAGLLLGLDRTAAARFAFLLAVPAIAAAAGYELLQGWTAPAGFRVDADFLVGFGVAGTTAYLTIDWFMRFVERHGMGVFAVYRLLLGLAILTTGL